MKRQDAVENSPHIPERLEVESLVAARIDDLKPVDAQLLKFCAVVNLNRAFSAEILLGY